MIRGSTGASWETGNDRQRNAALAAITARPPREGAAVDEFGLRAIVGVAGIIVILLMTMGLYWLQDDATRRYMDNAGKAQAPYEATPGLAELDRLRRSQPEAALDRCRKLAREGQTEEERRIASEMVPEILFDLFQRRRSQRRYDECEKLALEFRQGGANSSRAGAFTQAWRDLEVEWIGWAAAAGDRATADRLLADLRQAAASGGTPESLVKRARQGYLDGFVARWKRAGGLEDPGRGSGDLDAAAAVSMALGSRTALVDLLARSLETAELLKIGNARAAAGQNPAAILWLQAGISSPRAGRLDEPSLRAARHELARCRIAVARDVVAGRLPGLGVDEAERLVTEARGDPDPRGRPEALQVLLDLLLARARQRMQSGQYGAAEASLKRAVEQAKELWLARCALPGHDSWSTVPRELAERIEDEHPDGDRASMLSALGALVAKGTYTPPEADSIKAILPDLYARWGLAELEHDRETALARLRPVLRARQATVSGTARGGPDGPVRSNGPPGFNVPRPSSGGAGEPAAIVGRADRSGALVVEGLRNAIRKSGGANDFGALADLGGFYVAEASLPGGKDPFRDELKKWLDAACEHFRGKEPLHRVFLLSLVADLFPGEPAGAAARDEALAAGCAVLEKLSENPIPRSPLAGRSPVPGLSIYRIENGTAHHLMAFFKGVESFFVRLNPIRRGAVALKDGTYSVAVLVTREEVRPYRGDVTFAGEERRSTFYIRTVGGTGRFQPLFGEGSLAPRGDFELLRAPAGTDPGAMATALGGDDETEDTRLPRAVLDSRSVQASTAGEALRTLAGFPRERAAFEAVREAALRHPDANVRILALEKLPVFRRRFDVVSVLRERLASDSAGDTASWTILAAVASRRPDTARFLDDVSRHGQASVRRALVSCLSRERSGATTELAEPVLASMVRLDPDPQIRSSALRALAERRSRQALPFIEAQLASADPRARSGGVFLLSAYFRDSPSFEPTLLAALEKETDSRSRDDLVRTLALRGSPGLLPIYHQLLGSSDPARVQKGLFLLHYWKGPLVELLPVVERQAASQVPEIRRRAVERLAGWRLDSSLPCLRAMLSSPDRLTKVTAVRWLAEWDDDRRALDVLGSFAQDKDVGPMIKKHLARRRR
ncbi:MAG: hypothetical protein HY815_04440 [Candidatus Riflebacteria bacterium]|nr:hypothetical protein [Candidatus Riflebacteria bacterium]